MLIIKDFEQERKDVHISAKSDWEPIKLRINESYFKKMDFFNKILKVCVFLSFEMSICFHIRPS